MATTEPTHTGAALRSRLAGLDAWREHDGALERRYETNGWGTTLMLAGAIGFAAEIADHHPDLLLQWGGVTVRLSTHSAGGITDKDVALAREIEALALARPGADSPLTGSSTAFVRGGGP